MYIQRFHYNHYMERVSKYELNLNFINSILSRGQKLELFYINKKVVCRPWI